jgi:hypothetical protein
MLSSGSQARESIKRAARIVAGNLITDQAQIRPKLHTNRWRPIHGEFGMGLPAAGSSFERACKR